MSQSVNMLLLFFVKPQFGPPPPGSNFRVTDANIFRQTDEGNLRITDQGLLALLNVWRTENGN